jgi:hypothetical protein
MSRDSGLPRRYDDDEVARILKRATEIRRDQRLPARPFQDEGLSLEELEEIASEAGIDVAHLRQAALEVDTGTDRLAPMEQFVGGPLSVAQEEVVEGELDEDGFQVLLHTLQQGLGEFGLPSLMARTLTWKNEAAKNGGRSTMATISVRSGRTTIRIEESYQQVAGGFQGGITVGGGVGFGVGLGVPLATAAGSVLTGIAFPVGAILAAYVIARGTYRDYVGRRRRKIAEVLARMAEVARQEVGPQRSRSRGEVRSSPDRPRLPGGGGEGSVSSPDYPSPKGPARGADSGGSPDSGPEGSLL